MLRNLAVAFSVLSLAACVVTPLLYFQGTIGAAAYKQAFAVASLVWFVAATTWATRRRRDK